MKPEQFIAQSVISLMPQASQKPEPLPVRAFVFGFWFLVFARVKAFSSCAPAANLYNCPAMRHFGGHADGRPKRGMRLNLETAVDRFASLAKPHEIKR